MQQKDEKFIEKQIDKLKFAPKLQKWFKQMSKQTGKITDYCTKFFAPQITMCNTAWNHAQQLANMQTTTPSGTNIEGQEDAKLNQKAYESCFQNISANKDKMQGVMMLCSVLDPVQNQVYTTGYQELIKNADAAEQGASHSDVAKESLGDVPVAEIFAFLGSVEHEERALDHLKHHDFMFCEVEVSKK